MLVRFCINLFYEFVFALLKCFNNSLTNQLCNYYYTLLLALQLTNVALSDRRVALFDGVSDPDSLEALDGVRRPRHRQDQHHRRNHLCRVYHLYKIG